MSRLQTWRSVRDELEARRAALNGEIASYPAPITACDAQFNHMLELRAGLNTQLVLLSRISEGADAKTLARFVAACPFRG